MKRRFARLTVRLPFSREEMANSLSAFLLLWATCVRGLDDPAVPGIFFPFGGDVGDSVLPVDDDGFSSAQYIETGFPFFNVTRRVLFVSIKLDKLKGLSTPGNKVAGNGNKLLSETATDCCPKRQQPDTATLSQHLSKSPFLATICCRFQQLCCLVWTGLKLHDM